jgi:hypothetical protein
MSANGREKLIAKIQHFYDLLVKHADENKDKAITESDQDKRFLASCVMQEYACIAATYVELFKEFLHAEPGDA